MIVVTEKNGKYSFNLQGGKYTTMVCGERSEMWDKGYNRNIRDCLYTLLHVKQADRK